MKNIMKNRIFKMMALMFVSVVTSSCNDDFLNISPSSSLSDEGFFRSADDAELALNGVYNCLLLGLSTSADGCEMILYDLMTDNGCNINTSYYPHNIVTGQMTSSSPAPRFKWEKKYKGIARANLLLARLDQCFANEKDKTLRDRYEGEALFLRSFFYADLIDFFGNVPLKLEPADLSDSNIPRSPKEEILEIILKDLDTAIEKLPVRYATGKGVGRATKGAALALKGKLLLFNNRFGEAAAAFKQLIDLKDEDGTSRYELYPDFRKLFLVEGENSDETIFDVQYIPGYWNNDVENSLTTSYNISVAHYNSFAVTLSLACEFYTVNGYPVKGYPTGPFTSVDPVFDPKAPLNNRDPRLEMTICRPGDPISENRYFAPSGSNVSGMKLKKGAEYTETIPAAQISHNNIMLIRYADVLLMYAEALIRSGDWDNPDVYNAINSIRQRPNVMMPKIEDCEAIWDAPLDQEKMFKIIQHERRVELAFEGQRISDIRRWKIGQSVMMDAYGYTNASIGVIGGSVTATTGKLNGLREWEGYVCQKRVWNEQKSYLWPIPDLEINSNKELGNNPDYPEITIQNPGY